MNPKINCTLLFSVFFFGTLAMACPDLAGNWTCHDAENGTYSIGISQEPISNGVLYRFAKPVSGNLEIRADGNPHPFQDGEATGTQTATCTSGSTLNVHTVAKENSGNFVFTVNMTLQKKHAKQFDMSMQGWIQIPDQPDQEIKNLTSCDL